MVRSCARGKIVNQHAARWRRCWELCESAYRTPSCRRPAEKRTRPISALIRCRFGLIPTHLAFDDDPQVLQRAVLRNVGGGEHCKVLVRDKRRLEVFSGESASWRNPLQSLSQCIPAHRHRFASCDRERTKINSTTKKLKNLYNLAATDGSATASPDLRSTPSCDSDLNGATTSSPPPLAPARNESTYSRKNRLHDGFDGM